MAREHDDDDGDPFDPQLLDKYLREINKADDALIKLKTEHMTACKGPRGRIRNVMKEAREAGANMEALRAIIAKQRAERKIDQRIAELEADDREDYEAMLQALGEFGNTDLGKAALSKAKRKDGGEKLDQLHS
jgi:DUF1009 family protein